jgi:hypothetical protein
MAAPKPATNMPSEVTVLRTAAAAKKGPGAKGAFDTETTWPKPEFVCYPMARANSIGTIDDDRQRDQRGEDGERIHRGCR